MTDPLSYPTEQERFWAGDFGDEYVGRNRDAALLAANVGLFRTILRSAVPVASVLELGANIERTTSARRRRRGR